MHRPSLVFNRSALVGQTEVKLEIVHDEVANVGCDAKGRLVVIIVIIVDIDVVETNKGTAHSHLSTTGKGSTNGDRTFLSKARFTDLS